MVLAFVFFLFWYKHRCGGVISHNNNGKNVDRNFSLQVSHKPVICECRVGEGWDANSTPQGHFNWKEHVIVDGSGAAKEAIKQPGSRAKSFPLALSGHHRGLDPPQSLWKWNGWHRKSDREGVSIRRGLVLVGFGQSWAWQARKAPTACVVGGLSEQHPWADQSTGTAQQQSCFLSSCYWVQGQFVKHT